MAFRGLHAVLVTWAVVCASAHSHQHSSQGGRSGLHVDGVASATNHTAHEPQLEFGDLTCMRWTGGSCAMFSCSEERGPTECVQTYCMCPRGLCADAEGKCVRQQGKWLGDHSIRFENPYDPEKPYLGVAMSPGVGAKSLAATSSSQRSWKIALTPGGHVRFESMDLPGNSIHLYLNRRRRRIDDSVGSRRRSFFLQEKLSMKSHEGTNDTHTKNISGASGQDQSRHEALTSIPDDDDIWPILIPFEKATPLDITFRARPTHRNGGGLEIWDPQSGHVLASGNTQWYSKDHVASNGIAECSEGSLFGGSDCEGRQLVKLEPALPMEATPFIGRNYISAIGTMNWWQTYWFPIFCVLFIGGIWAYGIGVMWADAAC